MIKIIIEGEPQGKARPRMNTVTKRTYTPAKTKNYEDWIKTNYNLQSKGFSFGDRQVRATIDCFYKIPTRDSKKKREEKLSGGIRPTKKPDIDNVTKSILDGLNGLAYKDDSQVVELECNKYYSNNPRVEILLSEV